MKFYFDKDNGTTAKLTRNEVAEHMSKLQIKEAIDTKKCNPTEKVIYATVGGYIRVEM